MSESIHPLGGKGKFPPLTAVINEISCTVIFRPCCSSEVVFCHCGVIAGRNAD